MSRNQLSQSLDASQKIKKFFLSAAVVGMFGVYTAAERISNLASLFSPTPGTSSKASNATLNGHAKDGTYTGSEEDAYYGRVKVQSTIKAGKLADVQFLEYPKDRRTSQHISAYATPYLMQEAIQAQTANVDIISGATLTSQAFQMSLRSAINLAQN